jgi:hypothetical protein
LSSSIRASFLCDIIIPRLFFLCNFFHNIFYYFHNIFYRHCLSETGPSSFLWEPTLRLGSEKYRELLKALELASIQGLQVPTLPINYCSPTYGRWPSVSLVGDEKSWGAA